MIISFLRLQKEVDAPWQIDQSLVQRLEMWSSIIACANGPTVNRSQMIHSIIVSNTNVNVSVNVNSHRLALIVYMIG